MATDKASSVVPKHFFFCLGFICGLISVNPASADSRVLRCPLIQAGQTAVISTYPTGAQCLIIKGGSVNVSDAFIIQNQGDGTFVWRTYVAGIEGHPGVALCNGDGCGTQHFGEFSCDPLLGGCSFLYSYRDPEDVYVRFSIPASLGKKHRQIFDIPNNSLSIHGGVFSEAQ